MAPPRKSTWATREKERAREVADAQMAIFRCALCKWRYRGSVAEGKRQFRVHRQVTHA